MAIELVTGKAGTGHVSSADFGRFQAGICGTGRYVLNTGSKFPYTIESANQITIGSGDAVDQGRHIVIPTNSTENVGIQNGTSGKVRIDLVVIQYSKDTSSAQGIETAELVVLTGTEVAEGSTPTAPVPVSGDIIGGAVLDQMPLYEVLVTAQGISTVTPVFTVLKPLDGLSEVAGEVIDKVYPVGSIYMSVNNANPGTLFGGTWERIQGKFLLGASSGHGAGSTGGAESVTLTQAQLPAHTHSIPAHTHTVPAHTHTVPAHTHTGTTAKSGNHRHAVRRYQTAAVGGNRFCIQGTDDNVIFNTNYAGEHTHTFTTNAGGGGNTGSAGAGNTGSGGEGNTGSVGSGSAVGIMPPFLAVYIWKRTA